MAYGESCQWPASFVHACMALAAVVHAVEVSLIWLPLEPELQLPASRPLLRPKFRMGQWKVTRSALADLHILSRRKGMTYI
jgi:hypothetical protein